MRTSKSAFAMIGATVLGLALNADSGKFDRSFAEVRSYVTNIQQFIELRRLETGQVQTSWRTAPSGIGVPQRLSTAEN